MKKQWLVLYTKPRNEKKVTLRLTEKGYQVYLPLIKTLRQWNDRKKKVKLPMFPSYVFIYLSELEREEVVRDPGVLNFLFWLGKPAVVRDKEMEAIEEIAEKGEEIEVTGRRPEKGQFVEIPDGPFKGMTGEIDKVDRRKVLVYIKQLDCVVMFKYNLVHNDV